MKKMIMLDGWNFIFEERTVLHAFSLFDNNVNPTEVSQRLKLTIKEVLVIMLDWSDKRGKKL